MRLSGVVRFFAKLLLGNRDEGRKIDVPRQDARQAEGRSEVVHVAVYAPRDARVLDLHCQVPPVHGPGSMNLTDGGSGDGLSIKAFETRLPIGPERVSQHGVQLRVRHRVRRVPK